MEESQTWRELLGQVISEPLERQRIADALGIHFVTLTRWVTNRSNPRPENLQALVKALPKYRLRLIELIKKEYSDVFSSLPQEKIRDEIPATFYSRVLNAYTSNPPILRGSTISTLILQQMLGHLDPERVGMAIFIAQCVPPIVGQKVRSLRRTVGRGTLPWESQMDSQTQFFGAESPVGLALNQGHVIVVQDHTTAFALCPHQPQPSATTPSALIWPILQSSGTFGCLCMVSHQPIHDLQEHQQLINSYVDLIVLAFERHELYDLSEVELGLMPPSVVQQPHLACFSRYVRQCMLQSARDKQSLTRPQAEVKVWQQFEEKFLELPFDENP